MRRTLVTTAAFAAALVAAACSKPANTTGADNAASNTEAASANPTTNTADGASAKGSDAVSVAQDAASAVVGPITAATAGALSAGAFVENAARSDMYETESSKLALAQSKSPAIKKFAAQMIAAHAKTTASLKAIVTGGKAGDAKLPDALDDRRQGLIDNLKSASADDFDARFVDQQAAAHRETEILMKGYGAAGQNDSLKAFAKETAPKVAAHLNMVEALDKGNADKDNKTGDGGKHA